MHKSNKIQFLFQLKNIHTSNWSIISNPLERLQNKKKFENFLKFPVEYWATQWGLRNAPACLKFGRPNPVGNSRPVPSAHLNRTWDSEWAYDSSRIIQCFYCNIQSKLNHFELFVQILFLCIKGKSFEHHLTYHVHCIMSA